MTTNTHDGKRAHKVTPYLTFNDSAEEAVRLYVSIFKNSKIHSMDHWQDDGPVAKGKVMNARFELDGQPFMAMDAGPTFTFAQGHSLYVDCDTQAEIDHLSAKLIANGGEQQPCGWVLDRFGVSWQIIPKALREMMETGTPEQTGRMFGALMQMTKLDIKGLERAFHG